MSLIIVLVKTRTINLNQTEGAMFGRKLLKNYTSDFEKFIREFDAKRKTMPDSRIKEVEKHKKIAHKRDNAVEEESSAIWKGFESN